MCNVAGMVSNWELEKEGKPYDGPWMGECSEEEFTSHFPGWEPEVQTLLKVRGLCYTSCNSMVI